MDAYGPLKPAPVVFPPLVPVCLCASYSDSSFPGRPVGVFQLSTPWGPLSLGQNSSLWSRFAFSAVALLVFISFLSFFPGPRFSRTMELTFGPLPHTPSTPAWIFFLSVFSFSFLRSALMSPSRQSAGPNRSKQAVLPGDCLPPPLTPCFALCTLQVPPFSHLAQIFSSFSRPSPQVHGIGQVLFPGLVDGFPLMSPPFSLRFLFLFFQVARSVPDQFFRIWSFLIMFCCLPSVSSASLCSFLDHFFLKSPPFFKLCTFCGHVLRSYFGLENPLGATLCFPFPSLLGGFFFWPFLLIGGVFLIVRFFPVPRAFFVPLCCFFFSFFLGGVGFCVFCFFSLLGFFFFFFFFFFGVFFCFCRLRSTGVSGVGFIFFFFLSRLF